MVLCQWNEQGGDVLHFIQLVYTHNVPASVYNFNSPHIKRRKHFWKILLLNWKEDGTKTSIFIGSVWMVVSLHSEADVFKKSEFHFERKRRKYEKCNFLKRISQMNPFHSWQENALGQKQWWHRWINKSMHYFYYDFFSLSVLIFYVFLKHKL